MPVIQFPPFEPDKNRFSFGAMPDATNVIPTIDGWGPMPANVSVIADFDYLTDENGNRLTDENGNLLITGDGGTALNELMIPDPVLGMIAKRLADGTERIFAGTATEIYEFLKTNNSWGAVSRTAGGDYGATARWSFAPFGDVVYAANGVDAEQMIDVENDTNFSANSTAPIAKYIAPVGDFMMRGNIVSMPNRVQWSAINNPQANTARTDLSGFQDMPEGDEVMAIMPLSTGCHVIMRSAVQEMTFALNSGYTFTRRKLTDMRGSSAPYSFTSFGQDQYAGYFDDGFWVFMGQFQNVGVGKVNEWFLTESDQDERENIVALHDPERQIVWWQYTNTSSVRKMIGYHYIYGRWTAPVSVALQASCRARTFVYTINGSPAFDTDLLRFAAVDADGVLTYLTGDNLAATFKTNELSLAGSDRAFVNGGRLDGDPVNFTATLATGNYKGGALTSRSAVSPSSRTRHIPLLGDGRVHQVTIAIPAAETWSTVTGIDLEVQRSGKT